MKLNRLIPRGILIATCLFLFGINRAGATTISFDDMAIGSNPDGNYGDFTIDTFVRIGSATKFITRDARIDIWAGSQAVVAGNRPFPPLDLVDGSATYARIGVDFNVPVSEFSVDVSCHLFSFPFHYFGFDASGQRFDGTDLNLRTYLPGQPESIRLSHSAPVGGYLSGFFFEMSDGGGIVELRMDNLSYNSVPDGGSTGILLGLGFLGLGLFRRNVTIAAR